MSGKGSFSLLAKLLSCNTRISNKPLRILSVLKKTKYQGLKKSMAATCISKVAAARNENLDDTIAAVIVTIREGSSYDTLFTSVPRQSDEDTKVMTYSINAGAGVAQLHKALVKESSSTKGRASKIAKSDTQNTSVLAELIDSIKSVHDTECVVINFECCSGYSDSGFGGECTHSASVSDLSMGLLCHAVAMGYMVMCSDFSLKALITTWDTSKLGPNPFTKTGECSGNVKLHFDGEVLKRSRSAQLQAVGELCTENTVNVHCLGGTITYGVDHKQVAKATAKAAYKLEVLTVVEPSTSVTCDPLYQCKIDDVSGAAGHVMVTYPSGGAILASATHWIELMKFDVPENRLFSIAQANYGKDFVDEIACEFNACTTDDERIKVGAKYSCEMVQATVPCKLYNPRRAAALIAKKLREDKANLGNHTTTTLSHNNDAFAIDDEARLMRFLILGCEGGTYYASQKTLGLEHAQSVLRMLKGGHGETVVSQAVAVSVGGRAAKQTPTLFVLAMAARLGDTATRSLVNKALPKCLRTPTMLFEYISLMETMATEGTGWGRGMRTAVAGIYNSREPKDLAYWITKYRSREGWTHRDVLRLAHVKPVSLAHQLVLSYAVKNALPVKFESDPSAAFTTTLQFLVGVEQARKIGTEPSDEQTLLQLIGDHQLAREHVPSTHLNSVEIWEALLLKMPLTAMLRNLAKMTCLGLLAPLSAATTLVCERLRSAVALRKARVHPFNILLALKTYESGHGQKGSLEWAPVPEIIAALDDAFNLSFEHVEPTGKRFLLGMDVSTSMTAGGVNGAQQISPRVAAAAMAMATMRTETHVHPMAFTSELMPLNIHAKMSLNSVVEACDALPFGGTDCAQPMLYALTHKLEVDVFVVYTDCGSWAGDISPVEALRQYRQASGIAAKLVVIAMTSGSFGITMSDPNDKGMLDMVGFDASAPQILREFATGAL
eukprot:m.189328 g.189328  ORF g.189328 m.189328 type:complete len:951 (-) comp32370_c0_seq1:41-2893(-)